MKKLFLVGALALFGAVNAQVKFGLKAGYSMSSISEKYENTSRTGDAKSSFYGGALVEVKLNSKWALQGELLYSQLGAKDEMDLGTTVVGGQIIELGVVKQKIDLSTLMIPVGAKYFITNSFSANAGLDFVFYVSRNIEYDVPAYNTTVDDRGNAYFKTFNFAPYLGLEYQLTEHFFVDTRYNFGLANISQIKMDGYKMRNSFFQLGVGYKF